MYIDKKFGTFEFNKFTYESYYSVDEYKLNDSTISIIVYVETVDELKESLASLYKIVDNIDELDKSARKIFCEKLEASDDDLGEISVGGIYYYKDKHFEFIYDLPEATSEEVGLEYVKAIFDENGIATDATMDNY